MKTFGFLLIVFALLFSCRSSKRLHSQATSSVGWVNPLTEQLGKTVLPDTTFSFPGGKTLPIKPIELNLPDSLGGAKVNGYAKIFAVLLVNGEIESVELHSFQLKKGKRIVHDYHSDLDLPEEDSFFSDFKAFIEGEIRNIPIEQNIADLEEGQRYPTFGLLVF